MSPTLLVHPSVDSRHCHPSKCKTSKTQLPAEKQEMQPGLDQDDISQEGDTIFSTLVHQNRCTNLDLGKKLSKITRSQDSSILAKQYLPSAPGDEAAGWAGQGAEVEHVSCKKQDKLTQLPSVPHPSGLQLPSPCHHITKTLRTSVRTVVSNSVPEGRVSAFSPGRRKAFLARVAK